MSEETSAEIQPVIGNEEEIREKQDILDKLMHCNLPGWEGVKSLADVSIVRASGAMTNIIYRCNNLINDEAYSPVLVRIYGQGSELFFDRKREIELFTVLSDHAFGIRLITKMKEGRVEEWKVGFQPLTNEEVRTEAMMEKVAKKMAEMHKISIPNPNHEDVFNKFRKWYDSIRVLCVGEKFKTLNIENVKKEIDSLHDLFFQDEFPFVFAHLDLQHANILQNENKEIIYASSSSPSEDIADHFSEMMYDYNDVRSEFMHREYFPSEENRKFFIKCYLEAYNGCPPTQKEIDDMEVLVLKHFCVCTLHWLLWGILETPLSTIDWDYWAYSRDKFKLYKEIKLKYYGVEAYQIFTDL